MKVDSKTVMDIDEKLYGLKPMTFEEEANAPENIKLLRQNKIKIVCHCGFIKGLAYQIEERAKGILEIDDEKYVELISKYQKLIENAEHLLYEAEMLGKE